MYNIDCFKYNKTVRESVLKHAFDGRTATYPKLVKIDYKHKERKIVCDIELNNGYGYNPENITLIIKDSATNNVIFEKKATEIFDPKCVRHSIMLNVEPNWEQGSVQQCTAIIRYDPNKDEKDNGEISNFQKQWFMGIFNKNENEMFIAGYLRSLVNENKIVIVPMDIVGICYKYYYKWFVVLQFEGYEKQIMLMDDEMVQKYILMRVGEYKQMMETETELNIPSDTYIHLDINISKEWIARGYQNSQKRMRGVTNSTFIILSYIKL